MKTAASMPDELFHKAANVARRLRISRRELYFTAITQYLERLQDGLVTQRLNEVYARHDSRPDPAFSRAQADLAGKEIW